MFGGVLRPVTTAVWDWGLPVHVCPFDAIHMGEKGLPVVDPERCTGCGLCAKACVRGIIHIINAEKDLRPSFATPKTGAK